MSPTNQPEKTMTNAIEFKTARNEAVALRAQARQWPRCGALWPMNPEEEAAQAFFDAHNINELGRTPEEEAEVEAAFRGILQVDYAAQDAAREEARKLRHAEYMQEVADKWRAHHARKAAPPRTDQFTGQVYPARRAYKSVDDLVLIDAGQTTLVVVVDRALARGWTGQVKVTGKKPGATYGKRYSYVGEVVGG